MPEAEIKRLMKNLEEAVNETLSDSPKINECIRSIRDAGYEVLLVIDATVGFTRRGKGEKDALPPPVKTEDPVRLRLTSEDAKFLKSLKISVEN